MLGVFVARMEIDTIRTAFFIALFQSINKRVVKMTFQKANMGSVLSQSPLSMMLAKSRHMQCIGQKADMEMMTSFAIGTKLRPQRLREIRASRLMTPRQD